MSQPRHPYEMPRDPFHEPWEQEAHCTTTDPEVWFPEKGYSARKIRQFCANCPVIRECARKALDNDEHYGWWAGINADGKCGRAETKAMWRAISEGVAA